MFNVVQLNGVCNNVDGRLPIVLNPVPDGYSDLNIKIFGSYKESRDFEYIIDNGLDWYITGVYVNFTKAGLGFTGIEFYYFDGVNYNIIHAIYEKYGAFIFNLNEHFIGDGSKKIKVSIVKSSKVLNKLFIRLYGYKG